LGLVLLNQVHFLAALFFEIYRADSSTSYIDFFVNLFTHFCFIIPSALLHTKINSALFQSTQAKNANNFHLSSWLFRPSLNAKLTIVLNFSHVLSFKKKSRPHTRVTRIRRLAVPLRHLAPSATTTESQPNIPTRHQADQGKINLVNWNYLSGDLVCCALSSERRAGLWLQVRSTYLYATREHNLRAKRARGGNLHQGSDGRQAGRPRQKGQPLVEANR
jgi:hypothetical protein